MNKKIIGSALVGVATVVSAVVAGVQLFAQTPPPPQIAPITINNTGGQNTTVTGNNGTVTVDQRSGTFVQPLPTPKTRQLVIQHPKGMTVPLAPEPTLAILIEHPERVICDARSGSPIRELQAQGDSQVGPAGWRLVEVLDGDCRGKSGWVVTANTQYE